MKLAIVGSVDFTHPDAMLLARHLILHKLEIFEPDVVISGGADGIDSLAVECAQGMDVATLVFHPENRRWEPDGFKARNEKIALACTHMLAIRDHRSANNRWRESGPNATYGSGWTADYAERKCRRPVERIVL